MFNPRPRWILSLRHLIIGSAGTPLDYPLPVGLSGQILWRTQLRGGRLAVLVGRLLELDDQNRERIRYLREQLKPTATFLVMPSPKYLELFDMHSSPQGGNVILVVPMGEEAFRSEQDDLPKSGALPIPSRLFHYRNSRSTVDLIAPNKERVAVIELAEADKVIGLKKGLPNVAELGSVTMWIEPHNLIAGSPFTAAPRRLVGSPSINGASPRNWEYMIHARFDGSCLIAELRGNSVSLQNKNLVTPISGLEAGEEMLVVIPRRKSEAHSRA